MTDTVPVLFRADRKDGEVTAVFPTLPANLTGQMTCYAHIGQHGGCDYGWYRTTRPARPDEYASLQRELEGVPYEYSLAVVKRITPAMRDLLNERIRVAIIAR
jgi:hypothetical protein